MQIMICHRIEGTQISRKERACEDSILQDRLEDCSLRRKLSLKLIATVVDCSLIL